jgi:hypothetical protein
VVLWRIRVVLEGSIHRRFGEFYLRIKAHALSAWRTNNARRTRQGQANRKAMLRVGWVMLFSSLTQWREVGLALRGQKGRRYSPYGRLELRRMGSAWFRWQRMVNRRRRTARAVLVHEERELVVQPAMVMQDHYGSHESRSEPEARREMDLGAQVAANSARIREIELTQIRVRMQSNLQQARIAAAATDSQSEPQRLGLSGANRRASEREVHLLSRFQPARSS